MRRLLAALSLVLLGFSGPPDAWSAEHDGGVTGATPIAASDGSPQRNALGPTELAASTPTATKTAVTPKDAPTIALTYPTPNQTISELLTPTILLQASVADSDEAIFSVAFYACPASGTTCTTPPTLVGMTSSSPYQVAWTPPLALTNSAVSVPYLVWVAADNTLGQAGQSAVTAITLLQPAALPKVILVAPNALPNGQVGFIAPAAPVLYAVASPGNSVPPSSIVRVDFLDGQTVIGSVTTANSIPAGYAFVWSNPALGAHLVTARVTDSLGDWGTSSPPLAVYIVSADQAPQVTLTAPASGQIFTSTGSIALAATASSSGGSIQRVEFVAGTTIIATAFSSPYVATWSDPSPGNFAIVARAYDNFAVATASAAAYVEVLAAPRPPAVVLTAPAPGTAIASGVPLLLTASALSPDGSIGRVDFYSSSTLIGSAASAPYTFNWAAPAAGALSLTAKAYDLQGLNATSAAVFVTVGNTQPPSVSLTAPIAGATFAATTTVNLSASASETGGTIAKVDFLANGAVIGTTTAAPYNFGWTNVAAGSYALAATATDNFGAARTSASVNVTVVNDAPPSVALTAPTSAQTFYAGQPITLTATSSSTNETVSKVEFLADGVVVGIVGSAPFTWTWTGAAVGARALTARATDSLGMVATSAVVTITVAANSPPTVALTAPSNGQAFVSGQPITLTATASDTGGTVVKVEFLADGVVIGTATVSPYTQTWTGASLGTHALSARATDNHGGVTTSAAIAITVNSSSAPSVAVTLPLNNQTFTAGSTINLAASASDAGGNIVRVDFYAGSTLLGSATAAPYLLAWTNVPAGNFVLTAKATDNQAAVATSASVSTQVLTPNLTITAPAANASLAADFVLVTGTYVGPPNSGVTVNGVVANNDGQGNYSMNNFPLVLGANTLTVTLTTPDGQTTTQTQTVTSTARAPMQVYAEPEDDFAPATFTILLQNRTANAYANITYQNLGGGQLDTSALDPTTLGTITYTVPGVYMPSFLITDSLGNSYTQTVAIVVQDKTVVDGVLKAAWADFTTRLTSGSTQLALQVLSLPAQKRYAPTFGALAPYLTQIVPTWAAPQTGALTTDVGEYGVSRVLSGAKHLFFVYFVRDSDGVWRLDSM